MVARHSCLGQKQKSEKPGVTGFDSSLFDSDGYFRVICDISAQEAIAVEETESEDSDSVQDVSGSQHVVGICALGVKT
jgi:hypothetical protein